MVTYAKSPNGYFYKINAKGNKSRIPEKQFRKGIKNKIISGGTLPVELPLTLQKWGLHALKIKPYTDIWLLINAIRFAINTEIGDESTFMQRVCGKEITSNKMRKIHVSISYDDDISSFNFRLENADFKNSDCLFNESNELSMLWTFK